MLLPVLLSIFGCMQGISVLLIIVNFAFVHITITVIVAIKFESVPTDHIISGASSFLNGINVCHPVRYRIQNETHLGQLGRFYLGLISPNDQQVKKIAFLHEGNLLYNF